MNGGTDPIGWRTLQTDIRTPIGTWSKGLQVIALRVRVDGRVRVCLDHLGEHPNGRCHTANLPRAALSQLRNHKVREVA